jgi:hypothetical protein
MKRCVKKVEVLELPYSEIGVNSIIVGIMIVKGSHGAFDVVGGIIA